jgi:hypothetical protein
VVVRQNGANVTLGQVADVREDAEPPPSRGRPESSSSSLLNMDRTCWMSRARWNRRSTS